MNGEPGRPGARALLRAVGSQLAQLVQDEVELARAELISDARSGRRTLVALALATVAALVGFTLLFVALVLALGTVMPGWAAALMVAVGVSAGGAVVGIVGWRGRPRAPLSLTRRSLREDWEWLKALVS